MLTLNRQQTLNRYARLANLPANCSTSLLDELDWPVPSLVRLAGQWERRRAEQGELAGRGVFLGGHPGCGASAHAASALLSIMAWYRASALYLTSSDYVADRIDSFSDGAQNEEAELSEPGTVDLLVLDGIGNEHRTQTDYAVHCINHLLRTRAAQGRPTVAVTTLASGDRWESTYGAAGAVLVEEMFDIEMYNASSQTWRPAGLRRSATR